MRIATSGRQNQRKGCTPESPVRHALRWASNRTGRMRSDYRNSWEQPTARDPESESVRHAYVRRASSRYLTSAPNQFDQDYGTAQCVGLSSARQDCESGGVECAGHTKSLSHRIAPVDLKGQSSNTRPLAPDRNDRARTTDPRAALHFSNGDHDSPTQSSTRVVRGVAPTTVRSKVGTVRSR